MFADRLRYLEIELSPWLFRAIDACEVLPISRNYFRLRRPLDRRIYELARKHCGHQNQWRVSLDVLQKKSGSNSPDKKFAFYVRHLAVSNHLPGYTMTIEEDQVVFWRRAGEPASVATRPVIAAPPPATSSERRIMVSSRAIERLYDIAPGWDKYMLENLYIGWAKDKDAALNEDARFLRWVGSYTKGKPSP
jgi:plasmid replication initiation protein